MAACPLWGARMPGSENNGCDASHRAGSRATARGQTTELTCLTTETFGMEL